MLKVLCIAFLGVLGFGFVEAQLTNQICIGDHPECKEVKLVIKAKAGNCVIQSTKSNDMVSVFSNQSGEVPIHTISDDNSSNIDVIKLSLDRNADRGVSKYFYQQFISNQREPQRKAKEWLVSLTEAKPYDLDIIYGLGKIDIDLSGLAMRNLNINSGGADVKVWYRREIENQVEMDTLGVKIDIGSLTLDKLNLSRAKVIIGEVGVGDMFLNLQNCSNLLTRVYGSVGIGDMVIVLPSDSVPILVQVNNSWVSRVGVSNSLRRIGKNTYVNSAYGKNDNDAIILSLDVSLGEINLSDHIGTLNHQR